ncbi:MAG: 23S rRNA (adenine(2503)-C(2))-methyltransferase RlmN [Spirochaetales bacterium]
MEFIQRDKDGTLKLVLSLADGKIVESVLLTAPSGRKTACLSSQIGCALRCSYCKTGTLGFVRNLTSEEILLQYETLLKYAGPIKNVVFMGMGEPLANLQAVQKAMYQLLDPKRYGLGLRHITISTAGLVPRIYTLAEEGPLVYLTLSLPSLLEPIRSRLQPGVSSYSLEELKEALLYYKRKARKRPTLAIVLLKGINDTQAHAREFAKYLQDLKPLVNLVPYNPVSGLPFQPAEAKVIQEYYSLLTSYGIPTVCRFPRGCSIGGACGQLGSTIPELELLESF